MEKLPNQADEELHEKYDIVFIGGGPSTLSFFSFICRNKNFENFFANLNTLIIEKSETFGSGCLGKYGINSNTSAEGFVRLICFNDDENGKEEKQNLSPNKKKPSGENSKSHFFSGAAAAPNSNNNVTSSNNNNTTSNFSSSAIFQKFKNKCVPIFEDLLHSNETKNLLNIGSKIAPLSMIGSFLDCVGNSIASYIHSKFHKRIFMNNCEVMKINVDYDKCFESNSLKISEIKNSSVYPFEIFVEKNQSRLNNTSNNRNFSNSNGNNNNNKENSNIIKHFIVKSKIIVMASGAQQKFDNKQKQDIIKLITPSDFFHSDYVLQEKGFNHLINNLKLKEKRRVVILGGSHSGFSCAWMLLNGHIDIYRLKEQNKSIRAQSAFENPNNNNNNNNNYNNQNEFYYKCKINQDCLECKTLNCCFGSVIDRSWGKSNMRQSIAQNALENLEILILYRDHIKVYYPSEREALNDGYNVFDQSKAVNKNGNVYPFVGIRGDAKELYRRIVTGKEKRVKLQKANNFNEQKNFIVKASVVIWACGYTTQKMTFFDANCKSKETEFHLDANNQFDVDKELHLLNKKKAPFFNLFGIGQGYSTHSIEVLGNGKFARADSVNLYNTYISKKLFKALDAIFNFTGESIGQAITNEKEKENMKKTVNGSKGQNNNNNNHSSINNCNNNVSKNSNWNDNNNNEKTPFKKTAGAEIKDSSQANLKQMQNNFNSNTGNKNTTIAQAHNQYDASIGCNNHNRINKENEPSSSKKIIQLIPNDSSSIRNSISNSNNKNNNIINNHRSKVKNNSVVMNNNDINLGASSTFLKKTNGNGQNVFNTPNIKTVKMISNNLASVSLHLNSILNGTSEAKKANLTKNSVLTNSSVFQGNLSSSTNNNGILRASYSRGLDKLASSSKTNVLKNNNNNEFNLENNNPNNNHNINHKYSNANNNNNNNAGFSPPSRNINSRSPVNIHAIETAALNRNFPTKRESSRLKALQPIANINMNFNNNGNSNNNQNVLGTTKTNAINKNFSNLNNLSNNNNYNNNNNNNNNLNVDNFGNHCIANNQNNLTPNLYTNKNVLVVSRDRDFASKSPKTSSGTLNLISTSNNDLFKSSYKDLKEKNSIVNSTNLRKGNFQDFPRNQVYFGKTQINPNLKSTNINLATQNNIPSEKFNELGNRNNNNLNMVNYNNNSNNNNLNANHNKFPSYNLANMDKTGNRYEISPIPNAARSKSKYILYDSTKNIIPNLNGGVNSFNNNIVNSINQNYNFNYSLHSNNLANVLGKI